MYKVFFNQKPLVLTDKILETSDSSPLIFIKYTTASLIIKALKSKNNEKVYLYHKNMDKLWEIFLKKFPVIQAAGGLVERTDGKLLFIFRNDKWDLPKGGVEKKELIIEAAKREVTEETGVADIIVNNQLSETYHIFKKGKNYRLKKTYWFKMNYSGKNNLKPQISEGIEKVKWLNFKESTLKAENSFESIKELWRIYST